MDLPFFSPFILREQRQQYQMCRKLHNVSNVLSRRNGGRFFEFPSLEPTGNMRKKRTRFFCFATRGTAPKQYCVSLFSCKRVGVHHFV